MKFYIYTLGCKVNSYDSRIMTEDLIKQIKGIKQALVNVDMSGDDWEEREEILDKLEDVTTYLKDAMGKGIEF